MNLRGHAPLHHPGIQLAPLVDVLLLLLIFFLLTRSAAGLLGLATLAWTTAMALAQWTPEVRRARPVDEPPVARALPLDELNAAPPRRSTEEAPEPRTRDSEAPDRRQLDYANALFTRKLYDLAAPEYQKYLDDYPGSRGRANAYFSLCEC